MIRFFNTYSRELEEFRRSRDPPNVSIYTCGPTVYSHAHIGNFRAYIFEDLLQRHLEARGLQRSSSDEYYRRRRQDDSRRAASESFAATISPHRSSAGFLKISKLCASNAPTNIPAQPNHVTSRA